MALYSERYRSRRQRIVAFKMPDEILERLDRYAARRSMSRSEAIREALILFLALRARLGPGGDPIEDSEWMPV